MGQFLFQLYTFFRQQHFSICWSGSKNTLLGLLLEFQATGRLRLLVSPLALEEAKDNLRRKKPAAVPALKKLAASRLTVPDADLPLDLKLPEKDRLLLSAAIAARAAYFITGNSTDFKALWSVHQGDQGPHPLGLLGQRVLNDGG